MTATQIAGRALEFDKKGHLVHFEDWDRELAEALAEEEGLTLGECHWKVIEFLRAYYAMHEIPPSPKVVIRTIGSEVSAHVPCTRKHLEALFPGGGCKQACRIAGLPRYYCHSC
ncbi:TusE/DsrC/DsvC family sulfur relay protein [Marichromatium bheemlicum]|uniref:Sulfurtransferase n=1 Tax=Marichromatium bheemlicum TaxID=365339 RepID=A0ABX1I5U4_9GAMM|nr:TusE/DsrC/DsvC family sulfur relay protein [Marichromatium bheemlicum]NKN31765.1 TusE/DsrC/DsvC family sulfur relay protein [Marichromatium bheemlicum]